MTKQFEERVRDALTDRVTGVAPPVDWEGRVLIAGRRRRIRRRAGTVAGAAAAVLAVLLAASAAGLPQALTGIEPVRQPGVTGSQVDVGDLPDGELTTQPYATRPEGDSSPTRLWFPGGPEVETTGRLVDRGNLRRAAGGIVVLRAFDGEQLLYVDADGSQSPLQEVGSVASFAVSPDGTRVAWLESRRAGSIETLKLAELPSGKILERRPIERDDFPVRWTPDLVAYANGRVVLDFDGWQSPYAWNPETGEIGPLLGNAFAGMQGGLAALSVRSDTVLLFENGCVRNLSLTDPTAAARWKRCDLGEYLRISPDGSKLAGRGPSSVWVRSLDTGELLWKQRFTSGLDLWDTIRDRQVVSGFYTQEVEWESSSHLLLTYGNRSDEGRRTYQLLRCSVVDEPSCERVPTKTGDPVTTLGTR